MSLAPASLPTRLHCEVAIPSGLRQGRLFVQLRQTGPEQLELVQAEPKVATHQIVNVWGMPLLTYISQKDADMCGELSRGGCWEFVESMMLLGLARPGMTVVDAGAHVGYYSVLLAHTLGASGKVFAFEPEPRNINVLAANALLLRQLYPQAAAIQVIPCGLSDQTGIVRLNVFDENSGMHSLIHGLKKAVEMVQVTTLDAFTEVGGDSALGRRFDLIKADVCGSELALLIGGERRIKQDRPIVIMNFDPSLIGPGNCVGLVERFRALDYAAFRVFNARSLDSYRTLAEGVRVLTADEVIEHVRRNLVGAHATLLALPEITPIGSELA